MTDTTPQTPHKDEAEGGCGVIGLASSVPVAGKHIIRSVARMRNRGNGKGGGLAMVGCFPQYPEHYAITVGLLHPEARAEVERTYIDPIFDVAHAEVQPELDDHREVGLEIRPPRALRYFARVRPEVIARHAEAFRARTDTAFQTDADVEDDVVYQNSFRLNQALYAGRADARAFVLSHGRNQSVLKAVGYAEDVARFYRLDEATAHVWIAHQRYPTRGRVWHPGGAHPFIGLDEALVHNGDFANFAATSVALSQRGYTPLFMTDTEVSVLAFDLYSRRYGYPLEVIFEALAPTTERDFLKLSPEKQRLYRAIQQTHLQASPDGPWFFIIARNAVIDARRGRPPRQCGFQLLGITDTSMLRPQVFALQENRHASVAVIASEQQAVQAVFQSMATDDNRFCPLPDKVWVARGGSASDGGAFVFNVVTDDTPGGTGHVLHCTDKFGHVISTDPGQRHDDGPNPPPVQPPAPSPSGGRLGGGHLATTTFAAMVAQAARGSLSGVRGLVEATVERAATSWPQRRAAIDVLTRLRDRRFPTGDLKRSALLALVDDALASCFAAVPAFADGAPVTDPDRRLDFASRATLRPPPGDTVSDVNSDDTTGVLVVDARDFPPEGDDSVARAVVRGHELGWRRFIVCHTMGDRFIGCGLGPRTHGVRLDVYGAAGDYLGSGLHGAELHMHGDAQDQVGQVLTDGLIVIHGNVGQTFLYGAKGGVCHVLGNAAGRPLINAVGRVRAIINGTCLDYCAESFMAGAATGGGFVLINGLGWDDRGTLQRLAEPYPGGNFFSLASGGAGYVADPHGTMDTDQLNGARFTAFTDDDWQVVGPHLQDNARHFDLAIDDVLGVDGQRRRPAEVFRKVVPATGEVLAAARPAEPAVDPRGR